MASEKRLIDANALIKDLEDMRSAHRGKCTGTIYGGYTAAMISVEGAKTVDAVEVVHGRWIPSKSMVLSAKCSECNGWIVKHSINEPDFKFCPHCGAKMDGDSND